MIFLWQLAHLTSHFSSSASTFGNACPVETMTDTGMIFAVPGR